METQRLAEPVKIELPAKQLYTAPTRAFVYRFYSDDALLYVGISKNPLSRFQGHTHTPAFKAITRITLHECKDMAQAREIELVAIVDEAPLANGEDARYPLRGDVDPSHLPMIREAAGMTPEDMARALGLFPRNYALLDGGRRRCSVRLMGRASALAVEHAIRHGVTICPDAWGFACAYMQGVNPKPYLSEPSRRGRPRKEQAA